MSKMYPSPDKQTEKSTRWLFRARQCWSGLSAGDLMGLETTYESICVVGTFDLVPNLALPCTASLPQCEGD